MSELSEAFEAMKEAALAKKSHNKVRSTKILDENGIEYDSRNNGIHLIVLGSKEIIDFWPSTGKFICRESLKKGRGVFNLIKLCR